MKSLGPQLATDSYYSAFRILPCLQQVDHSAVHKSGILNVLHRAMNEATPDGPEARELLTRVAQAYRILLTRPLKGAYLWVPDQETRQYISTSPWTRCLR